mmetsp:Transcript_22939/g.45964  ORF Transcript_22939/g.45964 Transcript_22939/m.45964 type:complete len:186 (-) Transcript_22939:491-1048(-)
MIWVYMYSHGIRHKGGEVKMFSFMLQILEAGVPSAPCTHARMVIHAHEYMIRSNCQSMRLSPRRTHRRHTQTHTTASSSSLLLEASWRAGSSTCKERHQPMREAEREIAEATEACVSHGSHDPILSRTEEAAPHNLVGSHLLGPRPRGGSKVASAVRLPYDRPPPRLPPMPLALACEVKEDPPLP